MCEHIYTHAEPSRAKARHDRRDQLVKRLHNSEHGTVWLSNAQAQLQVVVLHAVTCQEMQAPSWRSTTMLGGLGPSYQMRDL